MEQTKKWYQSKLVLLGISLGLIGGTDLAFGWLSGNITADQLEVVQMQYPGLKDGLQKAVESKNYFGAITTVAGFVTAIWRVWFTNTSLTS